MSQIIPIYIPTYISSVDYQPARVLPRLLFYNGQVDCEKFYVKDGNGASNSVNQFPYFDNYNASGSQFPTTGSKSLLFYNESSAYGEVPTNSLYTDYWETYVNLLYNPRTRLLNASAIIPLADYFKMELNDLVQFRGNYYHLRAINDYNLKNGECQIQLLGPILPQALPFDQPVIPTTTTTTTTTSTTTTTTTTVSYTSFSLTYSSTDGATACTDWEIPTNRNTYYAAAGSTLTTGTILYTTSGLTTPVANGYYSDGSKYWNTAASAGNLQNETSCGGGTAELDWSFTESGGANGTMDIYVNGSSVESRSSTSNGTITGLVEGDEIYYDLNVTGCTGGNNFANAYSFGIISDASCDESVTFISSATYTVAPGDIGSTLTLDLFAACDSGCL